jgi:membrane protein DedA with SNARE-associated domain
MGIIIFTGYYFGNWLDNKYHNDNNLYMLIATLSAVFLSMAYIVWRIHKITKK